MGCKVNLQDLSRARGRKAEKIFEVAMDVIPVLIGWSNERIVPLLGVVYFFGGFRHAEMNGKMEFYKPEVRVNRQCTSQRQSREGIERVVS